MSELRIEDRTKAYLVMLWTFWATVFSFSLAYPLCYWYRARYFTPKKYIDGRRLRFEGMKMRELRVESYKICVIIVKLVVILNLISKYFF